MSNHGSLLGHEIRIVLARVIEKSSEVLGSHREFVEKNQIIGRVGKSENDEGPHLHFEIWHNNLIIDPRNLIKEYKEKDVSIR